MSIEHTEVDNNAIHVSLFLKYKSLSPTEPAPSLCGDDESSPEP